MAVDVFTALANPVRRELLAVLREGPVSAGELASRFPGLSRPAVAEHLQILRQAQLVDEERRGRHRYYFLEPVPLRDVAQWLHPFERYWRERLRGLHDVLDEENP